MLHFFLAAVIQLWPKWTRRENSRPSNGIVAGVISAFLTHARQSGPHKNPPLHNYLRHSSPLHMVGHLKPCHAQWLGWMARGWQINEADEPVQQSGWDWAQRHHLMTVGMVESQWAPDWLNTTHMNVTNLAGKRRNSCANRMVLVSISRQPVGRQQRPARLGRGTSCPIQPFLPTSSPVQ